MAKKIKNIEEQVSALADNAIIENKKNEPIETTENPKSESKIINTKKVKKETEKQQKTKRKKASLRDIIDGSILTRDLVKDQMPFFLFLAFLAMIYIANKYDSEKMARDAVIIQNELKELRCEKIAIHSELDSISKQSSVVKLIKDKNLEIKQLVEPPKKIVITNNNSSNKNNLTVNK